MHPIRFSTPGLLFRYINRTSSVIGLVGAFLVAATTSIFAYFAVQQSLFLTYGVSAQATVLGKRQARLEVPFPFAASVPLYAHGKGGPRYLIQYEYTDSEGNKYKGEGRSLFDQWNRTKPGDALSIRYDSRKPASSQLESMVWEFWPTIPISLFGIAVVATFTVFGFRGLLWASDQVRIVKGGEAVPGRIHSVQLEDPGRRRNATASVITYEFQEASQMHSIRMVGKPLAKWKPALPIVILLDPKDPTRHAPDIFDARREERHLLFGVDK